MSRRDSDHNSELEFEVPDLDGFDGDHADVVENGEDDLLYLKYCFEGAASVSELSTALRLLADDLDRRASDGWSLVAPVDGGYVHLNRAAAPEKR